MKNPLFLSEILAVLLSKQGYNPIRASVECEDAGGYNTYTKGDIGYIALDEVWKRFSFPDGSSLELYRDTMLVRGGVRALDKLHEQIEACIAHALQQPNQSTQPTITVH